MPILLLRSDSSTPLSSLVENAQKKIYPLLEYDLQLLESRLDLVLLGRPDRKINACTTDEGFESDIDSLSLVSSDNDNFTIDKLVTTSSKTIETDSANGSSDSDTETSESKSKETNKDNNRIDKKIKQSFNLVDCVCYTDVKCTDILIFVIKKETYVFKFDDVNYLQKFYSKFTALKALSNQILINKNFETKFNLLHRTDPNGITHIEITKAAELAKPLTVTDHGPSSIISISNLNSESERITKNKDINSRQRTESKFIGTINKLTLDSKSKISKCNSVENILDDVSLESVDKENNISKVWNSAEDLLDQPKRPERRKKNRAPPPPILSPEQNILSGEYVRVKVNADAVKDLDNRLVIKSNLNELHPKKLPNFNMFGTKPNIASFMKKDKNVLRYEPKKLDNYNMNTKSYGHENSPWTNSVPRLLKKPKSKTPTPMAYRYIDTTQDYVLSHNKDQNSNIFKKYSPVAFGHNAAFSNYLRRDYVNPNRVISLNYKPKDQQVTDNGKEDSLRSGSYSFVDYSSNVKDNHLKSVIKGNKDESIKKKNDKKVTFSAYTTVQVL